MIYLFVSYYSSKHIEIKYYTTKSLSNYEIITHYIFFIIIKLMIKVFKKLDKLYKI